ncbi:MAG: recombinase family protein [Pseudomonadota bacterium]
MGSDSYDPNPTKAKSDQPLRAASYVRMSTEHQRYSIENQADSISNYAKSHNMEIVREYSDSGKSGLRIDGRQGLKQLLLDVDLGDCDFEIILVYDVSRWGRFQDADESAHYEYICRKAGLQVHYCAEQFANDGSPVATIVKGVKRAMAGEYSRELSTKVFAGQSRLIEKGFRQGGAAGYGLRRMLISEEGEQKGILQSGQQKSLQTDRVVLVPGPAEEVRTVNQIYHFFVERGMSESQIAEGLNERGHYRSFQRPWTRGAVREILTNEKYIGNNVFNRTSFKLKQKRVQNPEEIWVRADNVFEAIVPHELFHMAKGIIRERSRKLSDQEMLDRLKKLFLQYGYLSGLIIDETEGTPSSGAYSHRFGSLLRAYSLVGFTPDRDYRYVEINRHLRAMHPKIVAETIERIEAVGAWCEVSPATQLVNVSDEFTVAINIARHQSTGSGGSRWKVRFETGLKPDLTVAIRMDHQNQSAYDYYILPTCDVRARTLNLSSSNGLTLDAYRFDRLDRLFEMARRKPIQSVA